MKRNRNAKITATVGPVVSNPKNLERLYLDGVDIFRMNFSHGSHEEHAKTYEAIRAIGKRLGVFPTIFADLQGPKFRIGTFEDDKIILQKDDAFRFDLDSTAGDSKRAYLPHPEIFQSAEIGTLLLLDDGKLKFEVISRGKDYVETRVLVGGELSNRKGVAVPNLKLHSSKLTKKDEEDLKFALNLGVDWIVLSMVQSVEDIEEARNIIGERAGVMTKLETALAAENFEAIIEASDAILLGRGDLGTDIGFENVPSVQRKVVRACRRMGRPVIVATQMLESMINSPTPTRAEVSDVATAVCQEADAVMLSAETASGKYPFEAVKTMDRVIKSTESDSLRIRDLECDTLTPRKTTTDALCTAAKEAAEYSDANAIALFTDSFATVLRCSATRPRIPIILVTDSVSLAGKAGLCCGVYPAVEKINVEQIVKTARSVVAERRLATMGDNIIIVNDITAKSVEICKVDTRNAIV